MTDFFYKYSGLNIRSEIEIPEWSIFETPANAQTDISFTETSRDESVEQDFPLGCVPIDSSTWRLSIPDTADYVISDTEIAVCVHAGARCVAIRAFLLGSAWGLTCHLRHLMIIHGSVVKIGDDAVAFCGESGAGKSSIAARLISDGHPLIADDLSRVEILDNVRALVYPSAPRLKLWSESLRALDWEDAGGEQDHARLDKYHVAAKTPAFVEPIPLSSIYLLAWGDLKLTRLTGTNALRRLIAAATYRPELIPQTQRLASYWADCAKLVERVTVWELSRPRDWASVDDVVALVLQSVSDASAQQRQKTSGGLSKVQALAQDRDQPAA